jgi:GNAT superfamily N-acetyltransferase
VEIRVVHADEYARVGAMTVEAYTKLPGHVHEPDYEVELSDVRTRAEAPGVEVLVAVDDDTVLGGVTFVGDPRSPMAEHELDGAGAIRMLAVDPSAQGHGIGEALVRACIARARELGLTQIALHSTPWMTTAHRLYGRLGFERDESLDWVPLPNIQLLGFRLVLT